MTSDVNDPDHHIAKALDKNNPELEFNKDLVIYDLDGSRVGALPASVASALRECWFIAEVELVMFVVFLVCCAIVSHHSLAAY
jgi:hypothetical protein